MTTDVNRLHRLIDDLEAHPDQWFNHRNGKTTLLIHQLAGEIQVGGHSRIIVQIKFLRDLDYLWPMIKEIFAEQGIEIVRARWMTFPVFIEVEYEGRETRLFFFPREAYQQRTRGYDCLEFNLMDD